MPPSEKIAIIAVFVSVLAIVAKLLEREIRVLLGLQRERDHSELREVELQGNGRITSAVVLLICVLVAAGWLFIRYVTMLPSQEARVPPGNANDLPVRSPTPPPQRTPTPIVSPTPVTQPTLPPVVSPKPPIASGLLKTGRFALLVNADGKVEPQARFLLNDERLRRFLFSVHYTGPGQAPTCKMRVEWYFEGQLFAFVDFAPDDTSYTSFQKYPNVIEHPGRFEIRLLVNESLADSLVFNVDALPQGRVPQNRIP